MHRRGSLLSFLDCIAFTGNTWRVGERGLLGRPIFEECSVGLLDHEESLGVELLDTPCYCRFYFNRGMST